MNLLVLVYLFFVLVNLLVIVYQVILVNLIKECDDSGASADSDKSFCSSGSGNFGEHSLFWKIISIWQI